MADLTEKETAQAGSPYEANSVEETAGSTAQGKPWMYRRFKIFGYSLPSYASPPSQLLLVSLVSFLCPGMFNAINGLGAGGQLDAHDVNNANVAVYSTFSVVGFFAGSIANRIGLRLTLSFGGLGYFIYVSSILCYNHTQNAGFLIFAGSLLGLCAGLLWTAQGAVMMSYPPEESKGRYISWFWMIFNLGAVIGGLVRPQIPTSLLWLTPNPDPPWSKSPLQSQQSKRRHLYSLHDPNVHRRHPCLGPRRLQKSRTRRRLPRHRHQEPNLEIRDLGPLRSDQIRFLHRPLLPHVLRQQLVLPVSIQRCQPSQIQYPDPRPQQRALLPQPDHRCLCLRIRTR
jgi:hypothetical protein